MAAVAALAMLVALATPPTRDPGTTPPASAGIARPFLVDVERLRTNALLAEAGVEPWAGQARAVVRAADRALDCDSQVGAGGSGAFEAAARALGEASRCAYTLAIAAIVSGDPGYVRRAAELLLTWSASDPCVLWARGCAETEPRGLHGYDAGDVRRLDAAATELVLAADLTRRRGGLPGADADPFLAWVSRLMPDTFPTGPDGDLANVLSLAIAGFTGDSSARDAAVAEWRRRLSFVRPDGRLTDGTDRLLGLEDAQRVLGLRLLAAEIAGPDGPGMLEATGRGGVRIRDAVDVLAAGMTDPVDWADEAVPTPGPMWELAYAAWGTPGYRPLLATLRGIAPEGGPPLRWSSLMFGLADARVTETPAPSGSPTPAPSPTEAPTPVPAVGVPEARLARGAVVDGTVPAVISWAAATGLPAGTVGYRVQLRQDEGRWSDVETTGRTSLSVRLPVGRRLEIRVRAASGSSATTGWSSGEPFELSLMESSAASLSPAAAWLPASNPDYSRQTLVYSERAGATITFGVEGRGIGLRVPVGPTRGEARVRIDGGSPIVIDEYAARFSPAVILFVAAWDAPGRHEVSIEVVGTPGRETVSVDALVVLP